MEGPVAKFESLLSSSEFLFIVYYRGTWCPFCVTYVKTLATLTKKITAAGGKPVIVTSEAPEHLDSFKKNTGYTDDAIVDTENVLATELRTRGLLDLAISTKSGYPNGMAQPGVLVIKKDGTVLYKWAIVPSAMNLGGAKDRPDLNQIWDNVEAKMNDKPVLHEKYDTLSAFAVLKSKIFG